MEVITWNLFHGRARPAQDRDLMDAFTARIAGWSWDALLLQECPPWWAAAIGRACGADARVSLTSRNALLGLRRALAVRRPELMRSGGGSANAILVRGGGSIAEHRIATLRRWPERRTVHAVRLAADGTWVGNLHAQVHSDARAHADAAAASAALRGWAGPAPAVLGGDFNVPDPRCPGFTVAGGDGVDHVAARGLQAAGPVEVLERGPLSDHAPVRVRLSVARAAGRSPAP